MFARESYPQNHWTTTLCITAFIFCTNAGPPRIRSASLGVICAILSATNCTVALARPPRADPHA